MVSKMSSIGVFYFMLETTELHKRLRFQAEHRVLVSDRMACILVCFWNFGLNNVLCHN